MSPNELIASELVSTARFIDNTFHAMLECMISFVRRTIRLARLLITFGAENIKAGDHNNFIF